MRRLVLCLSLLCLSVSLSACEVAFTPGVTPMPPPTMFQDGENGALNEERKTELSHATSVPAFGMSFVVGGEPMDAGALPKPPIPVVLLP